MCCTVPPVLHICGNWGHSAGSDGLWPLCGHLWPTAVHGHHVPKSLHGVGDLLLTQCYCMFCDSLVFSSSDPIRQIKCDQPLLLWSSPSLVSCLLWCHHESVGALHCDCFQWGYHHCGHPHILLVYSHHHPEDVLCRQRVQSFSTCPSHLAAIIVFHKTVLFIYCQPQSGNSMDTDEVATVFSIVVIPMLNPLIYSLRNKDVKEALRKVVSSKIFSQSIFS